MLLKSGTSGNRSNGGIGNWVKVLMGALGGVVTLTEHIDENDESGQTKNVSNPFCTIRIKNYSKNISLIDHLPLQHSGLRVLLLAIQNVCFSFCDLTIDSNLFYYAFQIPIFH